MKEKSKQGNITFTYSEVLQTIKEGINLWDFAIKFGISNLERCRILELLSLCTNNDNKKANELFEHLSSNSKKYIEENVNRDDVLNYNTLVYLAKEGYSRIDIMKRFGKTSYASFCIGLKKIYKKENIDEEIQKKIAQTLKENIKFSKVDFVPDLPNNNIKQISIADDCPQDTKKYPEKLVLYTIEYLKKQNESLGDELFCDDNDEKVILSCTLSKYIEENKVSETAKIKLTEAINAKKLGVLTATSEYKRIEKTNISIENDIVLSQALMLSRHTNKQICIATCEPQTALNALMLGFEIRIPKNMLRESFSDVTDENLNNISYYFDYNISCSVMPNHCKENSVVILDTCIIIDNNNNTNKEKILSDTTQLKILPRIVLNELMEAYTFFRTLFAVKCNPTIIIDLNTCLNYCYNDMGILNFAMYYQLTTGKDVTILTHDKTLYLEALKYNMKARYYPQTYLSTFEDSAETSSNVNSDKIECKEEPVSDKINEVVTVPDKDNQNTCKENIVYFKTVPIQKVSSKPVILNNNRITGIKSAKTLAPIELKGNKGYKYYPVELGDYVSFKNDPNLYKLVALSGKDNLKSIELTKLSSNA